MKKLLFTAAVAVLGFTSVSAQEEATGSALSKGSWLVEANTGFGAGDYGHTANTGFGLFSVDDTTVWSLGGEAGYFVMDDLAVKVGLGYNDLDGASSFSYKLGAKYYIASQFPVQVDLTGASGDDVFGDETPLWIGLQGGYAWFVADNISIEPGLRYNLSMNEDFTDEGILEFRVGFALHF
ncbi:hypothetical protein ITJ86_11645 [Winogradskyella sp. F6397]|uniref:Outer membrane protein beta-barrel domain-containing protein n=1 Tax=Winogradskyella marina TaxID=2785530 RepID=A0ABS0EJA8_9FLAO|nr:hypothetical protein [Winogradskyella marina]MBF8150554.1 hypothetical protein [Winogradskyella marina]